jgi:hypothetical protein
VTFLAGLKKVNWIADIFSPLAVILMEVFCLCAWLIYIGSLPMVTNPRPALGFLSLLFLLGGSFIVTRFFLKRQWPMAWIQVTIIVCGLIAIFLALRLEYAAGFNLFGGQWFASYGKEILNFFTQYPPFIFAIIAGLYLWWRGISLARSRLYFEDVYQAFLIQLATLVFLIISWNFTYKSGAMKNITSNIGIYVVGFFFFGLLAMALSNLRVLQEKFKKRGDLSVNFGRRWLTTILIVIGGVVLLGIGFATIFSTQFISLLGKGMSSVSGAYSYIVYYLLLAVGLLVALFYYVGEFLLYLLTFGKTAKPQDFNPTPLLPQPNKKNAPGSLSPQFILIIKLVFLVLIAAWVIWLIMKAIQRRHQKELTEDVQEEQESLWSWAGFKADLLVFLQSLFRLFIRKKKPAPVNTAADWLTADETPGRTLSVREIYQHLLRQGARLKMPREKYETPSEYARRLGRTIPDSKEPLHEITDLYLDVRYGEHPAEEKQTDKANSIWEKLRSLFTGQDGAQ